MTDAKKGAKRGAKTEPKIEPEIESGAGVWPEALSLSPNKAILTVRFNDGAAFDIDAELLRVEAPSADVQGHGLDDKQTPHGKRHVTIHQIAPVGHYAVRLIFSDGHDTGIYSWATLYRYGRDGAGLMEAYLGRLASAGLSRDL